MLINIKITVFCTLICYITFANMSEINKPIATYEEVKKLKDDETVLLIDVREPSELEEFGRIPGSINIPLGEVKNVLENETAKAFKEKYGREKPGLNFPIIFSCRSGRRSGLAQDIALDLGYKNVRNYQGSWLEWEQKIKNNV